MYEELASGREVVNLSPSQARDEAEHFLVGQGYIVRQRTATTLTVERESSESNADEQEDPPRLVVTAVPQPDGGVRIKVRGSDREGVHERQARWTEWMESLPKRQPAPVVRVRTIPMRGFGRASGMRRLLSANVILIAMVLIALVAILALTWLAISLLFEPGDVADLQAAPQRRWASEHTLPRPQAHMRDIDALCGLGSQVCPGSSGLRRHLRDDGYLHPRPARQAGRGSQEDRGSALLAG
jgi:hypothetical protein